MISFRKTVSTALVAATLAGAALASTSTAEARSRHFWGGVAVGAVGGLIVGNALAQPAYGAPVYVEEAPTVVYQPRVVYRRAPASQCDTYIKYDYEGRPFEWKDCN